MTGEVQHEVRIVGDPAKRLPSGTVADAGHAVTVANPTDRARPGTDVELQHLAAPQHLAVPNGGGQVPEELEHHRVPGAPAAGMPEHDGDGGEPACWIDRVCPACGAVEGDRPRSGCDLHGPQAEQSAVPLGARDVPPGVAVVRIYHDPGRQSGEHRVLVDRLWPRGFRSDAVDRDEWAKDIAPSTELRRWYGHDPDRFDEFSRRYRQELAEPLAASVVDRLRAVADQRRLVLLTATRDVDRSGAAVLRDVLASR